MHTQWLLTELVPAFCRTLLHSLWQGAVAALLAGVVVLATRKGSALRRYNGLVIIYALFLCTVAYTFFREVNPPASAAAQPTPATAMVTMEGGTRIGIAEEVNLATNIVTVINNNAALIVAIWALLFLLQLTRMAWGLQQVKTVRRRGTSSAGTEWAAWMEGACHSLGIRKRVRLLQSHRLQVPAVLGFLKPVVLVPVGLLSRLTPQQVEAVLLHELAHIRRHDYIVNLVQSFADAVFFFNPAVRWLSGLIRDERETCCDDIVLQHTGNKRGYVEALVSFGFGSSASTYALAFGSKKPHLLNRVKRILTRENSRLTAQESVALFLGTIILVSIGFLAFRKEEKGRQKEAERNLPVTVQKTGQSSIGEAAEKVKIRPIRQQETRQDTVPVPAKKGAIIRWKSISTNNTDDGQEGTTQVIAVEEDGTVYKLRKKGEVIVFFSVNGQEVTKDYPKYKSVMDAIEQARKDRTAQAVAAQQQKLNALHQQQQALSQKLSRLDEQRRATTTSDSLNSIQNRVQQQTQQTHQTQQTQTGTPNRVEPSTNSAISVIIRDLVVAGMVENELKLSFTLNNNELVVDGKVQDRPTFEKFRTKFLKHSGDRFHYYRDGNTTRSEITTE